MCFLNASSRAWFVLPYTEHGVVPGDTYTKQFQYLMVCCVHLFQIFRSMKTISIPCRCFRLFRFFMQSLASSVLHEYLMMRSFGRDCTICVCSVVFASYRRRSGSAMTSAPRASYDRRTY